ISTTTGCWERARKVRDATNWVAPAVMTTWTSAPSLRNPVTRCAALNAATPPVTPTTMTLPSSRALAIIRALVLAFLDSTRPPVCALHRPHQTCQGSCDCSGLPVGGVDNHMVGGEIGNIDTIEPLVAGPFAALALHKLRPRSLQLLALPPSDPLSAHIQGRPQPDRQVGVHHPPRQPTLHDAVARLGQLLLPAIQLAIPRRVLLRQLVHFGDRDPPLPGDLSEHLSSRDVAVPQRRGQLARDRALPDTDRSRDSDDHERRGCAAITPEGLRRRLRSDGQRSRAVPQRVRRGRYR